MKWENLRPLSPMFSDDMMDDYVDSKVAYEAWDGPVRRAVRLGCVGVTKQDFASFVISNAWRRSRLRRVFWSIERLYTRSMHAFITGHLYPDRLAGERFRCKYPNKSCGLEMSAVKQWNIEEHLSNIVWSARFCGGWTPAAQLCLNSERQVWVSTHGERSAEYYYGPDLGCERALKLFYQDVIDFWDRVSPLLPVYKEWFVGQSAETPIPQKRREIPMQNFPVPWSWSVVNGRICLVDTPYPRVNRARVPRAPRMVEVVDVNWDSVMPEPKPAMVLESFEGYGCRAVRYKWETPEVVDHIGKVYELNGRYTVVGATADSTELTTFYTLRDFRLVSYQTHARSAAGTNVGVLKRGEIRKFFDHVAGMVGTRVLVGGRFTGVVVGFSGGLHTVEFDNGNTSTMSLSRVGWVVDSGEKCY